MQMFEIRSGRLAPTFTNLIIYVCVRLGTRSASTPAKCG